MIGAAAPLAPLAPLAGMERLVNRLLDFDPDTRARLAALAGKVICLERRAGGADARRLYVLPAVDGVRLALTHDRADVTISAAPSVYARRLFARAASAAGEWQIRGDIDLGQRFQQVVAKLDIDGEEMLARVVGDVPARQLGNAARAVFAWARHAGAIVGRDVAEYLHEEAFILAKRGRVAAFLSAVDVLRADTDRLEQRLRHLTGNR